MKQSRIREEKWSVSGQYGGRYTNLQEAKKAAKFASTTLEYNYIAWVELIADGCNYFTYERGKCTRNGWTIKH